MRSDLTFIENLVAPGCRLLDIACGEGELLARLKQDKNIEGLGLEIDTKKIIRCLERGVQVVQHDVEDGLHFLPDNAFDTAVMTHALQVLKRPDKTLDEMLRVAETAVITFPNFGHWRCRWYLLGKGRMPVSKFMPYHWYDTPNIHFCTFRDFEALCHRKNCEIIKRTVVDQNGLRHFWLKFMPNLFGETAIYCVKKRA